MALSCQLGLNHDGTATPSAKACVTSTLLYSAALYSASSPALLCLLLLLTLLTAVCPAQCGSGTSPCKTGWRPDEWSSHLRTSSWFLSCAHGSSTISSCLLRLNPRSPQVEKLYMGLWEEVMVAPHFLVPDCHTGSIILPVGYSCSQHYYSKFWQIYTLSDLFEETWLEYLQSVTVFLPRTEKAVSINSLWLDFPQHFKFFIYLSFSLSD